MNMNINNEQNIVLFNEKLNDLNLDTYHKMLIQSLMNILLCKDEETYNHSIYVALKASEIAKYIYINETPLFIAGALHDIGKALVLPESLTTSNFTSKDMKNLEAHSRYSYQLLRGIFEFTAEVVLRHHIWQQKSYPKKLFKFRLPFSRTTKFLIDHYSRVLSLADFYCAITTRKNKKFGFEPVTTEFIKRMMVCNNLADKKLIDALFNDLIFKGNFDEPDILKKL